MSGQDLREEEIELKDLFQFLQRGHRIGRSQRWLQADVIHIYLIDTCIDSALDIGFHTIPDHNTFFRKGTGLLKRIFEDLLMRFEAVGAFRRDHFPEITGQAGSSGACCAVLFQSHW